MKECHRSWFLWVVRPGPGLPRDTVGTLWGLLQETVTSHHYNSYVPQIGIAFGCVLGASPFFELIQRRVLSCLRPQPWCQS